MIFLHSHGLPWVEARAGITLAESWSSAPKIRPI